MQGENREKEAKRHLVKGNKQIKQQEMLRHLRNLTHQPDAQARYALEILERA